MVAVARRDQAARAVQRGRVFEMDGLVRCLEDWDVEDPGQGDSRGSDHDDAEQDRGQTLGWLLQPEALHSDLMAARYWSAVAPTSKMPSSSLRAFSYARSRASLALMNA